MLLSKYFFFLKRIFSQIWIKITFFSFIALVTPFIANIVGPVLPPVAVFKLGAQSVDTILQIIASSMLAVSTFSLGIMANSFGSAAQSTTPRATQLLLEDRSSQNVLATFLGSFVFALVSIITLQIGLYDEAGRVVLLATTILILSVVFAAFVSWISLLRVFGRIPDTLRRVETASVKAIEKWQEDPFLGCKEGNPIDHQEWNGVYADTSKHVQHIDLNALNELATDHDIQIFIIAHPGTFACPSIPLVKTSNELDDDTVEKIRQTFSLSSERSFQQDPEFGFVVLSETASRALSSSLNDAGTAIDIVYRGLRLFEQLAKQKKGEVKFERLKIAPLNIPKIISIFVDPIMRDGHNIKEVHHAVLTLMKSTKQVELIGDETESHLLNRQLAYIERSEMLKADKDELNRQIQSLIDAK